VGVEGAIPLLQLIDDAVNKADESRDRQKADCLGETNASASAFAPVSENLPMNKKSWKERNKETDWADPKSIIANFPVLNGKKYGCIQPHPFMFSRITSPLLKAHAITCYWNMTGAEQKLVEKQLAV
jgi:hypothetical protein